MQTTEQIKQSNKDILAFYKSQEQRLRAQLKLLEANLAAEATAINAQLAQGPEPKNALRAHGIPDDIISQCKFSGSSKGVVVEFPRVTGKRAQPLHIPPFTKPTESDKQGLLKKTEEAIAELSKKILDNKK